MEYKEVKHHDDSKLLTSVERAILSGALIYFYDKGQTKVSYQDVYDYIENRSKTLNIIEIEHTMNAFMKMTPEERYELITARLKYRKKQHEEWINNPKKFTNRKDRMTPEEYEIWLEGQRIKGRERYALKKLKKTGKGVNKYERKKKED